MSHRRAGSLGNCLTDEVLLRKEDWAFAMKLYFNTTGNSSLSFCRKLDAVRVCFNKAEKEITTRCRFFANHVVKAVTVKLVKMYLICGKFCFIPAYLSRKFWWILQTQTLWLPFPPAKIQYRDRNCWNLARETNYFYYFIFNYFSSLDNHQFYYDVYRNRVDCNKYLHAVFLLISYKNSLTFAS